MYLSIILGMLVINTEEVKAHVVMSQIAHFELLDTDNGGILNISLKGSSELLMFSCHTKTSWKKVNEWFDDFEMEIIEGITKDKEKESKKARF